MIPNERSAERIAVAMWRWKHCDTRDAFAASRQEVSVCPNDSADWRRDVAEGRNDRAVSQKWNSTNANLGGIRFERIEPRPIGQLTAYFLRFLCAGLADFFLLFVGFAGFASALRLDRRSDVLR